MKFNDFKFSALAISVVAGFVFLAYTGMSNEHEKEMILIEHKTRYFQDSLSCAEFDKNIKDLAWNVRNLSDDVERLNSKHR